MTAICECGHEASEHRTGEIRGGCWKCDEDGPPGGPDCRRVRADVELTAFRAEHAKTLEVVRVLRVALIDASLHLPPGPPKRHAELALAETAEVLK